MGRSASEQPLIEALEYFGATPELLDENTPPALILPESLRQLASIFCAIQSQWRWHEGNIVGFDYSGIQAYIALSENKITASDFSRLQFLEAICLKYKNNFSKTPQ